MALQIERGIKGLFAALRTVRWHDLFLLGLIGIPVLICFCISAAIEMIVFRSILTGMGLQQISVFLALSLELFKLVIPFLLLASAQMRMKWQTVLAVSLRIVLVFISFSCTFVAISNNLVDANAEELAARNEAVRASVTSAFQEERRAKEEEVNRGADQQVKTRTELYAIGDRQAQLDALNQAYADRHDWSTYGLIVELNNTIAQAQEALNEELRGIEAQRKDQLAQLDRQYSQAALEGQIGAELERLDNTTSYDQSLNPSIARVIYLVKANFGADLSYESIVLLVALLICFASECIIWTGSTNLAQRYRMRYSPGDDAFSREVLRRAASRQRGREEGEDPDVPEQDVTPLIVFDERLTGRLVRRERVRLDRNLRLTEMKDHFAYQEEKRRLRREARQRMREEREGR